MKEAAGEANMTVITIVLIAIVLAVGTVIVNNVMNNTKKRSCCQTAGGTVSGNKCTIGSSSSTMDASWMKTYCSET